MVLPVTATCSGSVETGGGPLWKGCQEGARVPRERARAGVAELQDLLSEMCSHPPLESLPTDASRKHTALVPGPPPSPVDVNAHVVTTTIH